MPDPEEQFVMEVNASDTGAGVVLSQRSSDGEIHPCAYFSRHLSPAERNYAVGDRELLALKMALEEWRHLLKGSTVPFLVWTQGTWHICTRPNCLTLVKPDGLCFLTGLTLPSHTVQVPKTSSPTPCPISTTPLRTRKEPTPSSRPGLWSPLHNCR